MTKGYESVDTTIRELIFSKKMNTLHRYPLYYLWAMKGLREFKLDRVIKEFKTVKLPMSALKTIEYPKDMIAINKVGLKIGDRLETFINEESLALHFDKGQTKPNPNYVGAKYNYAIDQEQTYYNYQTDEGNTNLTFYGRGHSPTGYFRFNNDRREIQFEDFLTRSEAYLEIICDATNFSDETLIPVLATKMLEDWIMYRELRYRHGERDIRTKEAKQVWHESYKEVDGRQSDLSYAGLKNITARNMGYTKN